MNSGFPLFVNDVRCQTDSRTVLLLPESAVLRICLGGGMSAVTKQVDT